MALLTLNLLPPRIKAQRTQRMIMTIAVMIGIGLMSIPITVYYFKWLAVASLKSDLEKVKKEAVEYAGVIDQVKELETKEKALAQKLVSIDKLVARQNVWIKLLETISNCQYQVGDIWLTSLKSKVMVGPDAGKTEITLEGQAYSIDSLVNFQGLIGKSDTPVEFTKNLVSPMNTGTSNQTVVKFTTVMKVKV